MEWRAPQRQTIPGVLSAWASSQPDKTALVIDDVPLTYGDLWARSISVGNALTELGIGPRDTVLDEFDRQVELLERMVYLASPNITDDEASTLLAVRTWIDNMSAGGDVVVTIPER